MDVVQGVVLATRFWALIQPGVPRFVSDALMDHWATAPLGDLLAPSAQNPLPLCAVRARGAIHSLPRRPRCRSGLLAVGSRLRYGWLAPSRATAASASRGPSLALIRKGPTAAFDFRGFSRSPSRHGRVQRMPQKLDIGGVLSRTFDTYKQQAGVLLPIALVVFILIAVINAILFATVFAARSTTVIAIATPIVTLIQFIGVAFFQGFVVQLVRDVQDGRRDFSVGQLVESATPAVPSILGASILLALALFLPFLIITVVFTAVLGAAAGLVGILVLIASLIVLGTMFAVVIPAVVVERPGVIPAFGRSRELARGTGVQVFGVLVIVALIYFVVSAIFAAIGAALGGGIASQIVAGIGNALTAPIWALAAATMYFQLRQLKEGAGTAPGAAGAPAPGALGTAPGAPAQPAAPSQAPPPGVAGTTPEGPAAPRPQSPPPASEPPPAGEH